MITRIPMTTFTLTPMINSETKNLFRLIQFTDSAFPVGTFSFSNGLETAAQMEVVKDEATLKQYARSAAGQAAYTDGVTALLVFRAACAGKYAEIIRADQELTLLKQNDEARLMLARMGKKLAELGVRLYGEDSLFARWLNDINAGKTPGNWPTAQGIAFALEDMSEKELFVSHQYGVINMILSAALRLIRVSHYDTQKILFELGEDIDGHYERARVMNFENMNSYVPQMDIFASLHEKGQMRLFMN